MSEIDGVLWINLDRRTDRRAEMEGVLQDLGLAEKAERFPAIAKSQGILGCGLSHLECLRMARARGWQNVLIFEDDFLPHFRKEEFWIRVQDALQTLSSGGGYDVLMLSHNLQRSEPFGPNLLKVLDGQTASGYIVHRDFYDPLIAIYEDAMPKLDATWRHWEYANDVIWKKLQPTSRWYALKERLGRQRPSHSDNTGGWTDYGV
jgi:hypothetical protein